MSLNASCVPNKLPFVCIRLFGLLVVLAGLLLSATSQAQTFVPSWVQESPATSPSERYGAAIAYDATHGEVVLFGGINDSNIALSDTWVWNGTTWTQESPATSPAARWGAATAYDAASGQVVLFGGVNINNTAFLNDTWVWDGANWTLQSPGASPSVRGLSATAYDAASGQVVLFGGENISTTLGDTWVWNGTTWTQEAPATSPSSRTAAAMAYDAASGQVVLFGGFSAGNLIDTWVWNGTTWTQESTAASPSAREYSAMAYDSASGQVVLFGGWNGTSFLGDTWIWNGANWTQESPATSPSGRYLPGMVYDSASGQLDLFGGYKGGSLNDTWVWGQGDFGSQAIASTSAEQTLNFSIPASTTVGSIGVLTQGAANLDFTDAGGSTCTATTYSSSSNCTVKVQFKPASAGMRMGAVVFFSGAGNTGTALSSTPIFGVGTGPQIAYGPNGAETGVGTLDAPYGVAVDAAGNVYIGDVTDAVVYKITPGGTQTTAASGFSQPDGVAVDGAGNLYVADAGLGQVFEVTPGGVKTEVGAGFNQPTGVAVDGAENLYIVASGNSTVYKVTPAGAQTSIGSGYQDPWGVTVDAAGNVYVADQGGYVDKITPGGTQTTLGSGWSQPYGVAVDGAGDVYVADINNGGFEVTPAGTQTAFSGTNLYALVGVGVDGAGNVYFASNAGPATKIDRADIPSLGFLTTNVGTTSTDSPQTVEIENIGNQALNFTALSYPTDFPYAGSGANPCTGSTSLSAGVECDLDIDFTPLSAGSPLSENVTLTDNALNVAGTQQSIAVGGTATFATVSVTVGTSPVGALFEVDGTPYTSTQTFTWNVGTPHSLMASASYAPASTLYSFWAWSDGTPTAADTVTATAGVTSYWAGYTASSYLLTAAPNNSAWGSVTPASPGFYTIGGSTPITATANAGYYFTGWTGSTDIASASSASTTIIMNSPETIAGNFAAIPNLVVNEIGDDGGTASNCSGQPTPGTTINSDTCYLRDALLQAAALGAANITFDSTVFLSTNSVAANTINLTAGTLNIPSNTTIQGSTSGSGYALTNLVTVAGGGSSNQFSIFTVNSGVTAAGISGLTIDNGYAPSGGAIYNSGALTISNTTFLNNSVNSQGGAIYSRSGSLTILGSTFSTNHSGAGGAAIFENGGTLTVDYSTFSGNVAGALGGAIRGGSATLAVNNSTFSGNSSASSGGAIYVVSTTTVSNSIFSGNSSRSLGAGISGPANASYNLFYNNLENGTIENDCDGCTTNSQEVTTNPNLAPFGNYGGPTQTLVPSPGSGAICAASSALIPAGLTTDQRGLPDSTAYGSSTCYDIGAVQSNYALSFITSPSAIQFSYVALTPAPVVALTESSAAISFASSGIVTLTDTTTTLGGHTSIALSGGSATFPSIGVTTATGSDALTATLPLNPAVPVSVSSLPSSSFAVDVQVAATYTGPANGSLLPGPTSTFSWTSGVGIQYYELYVGTTGVASDNIYSSGLIPSGTLSETVTLPANEPTLYVRFRQLIGGVWQASDFTYNEPATATLTAPAPGATLTGSTATFQWSGGVGIQYYELYVGTSGVASNNIYSSGLIPSGTLSETVTLPANEPTLYVRFRQLIGGVWQASDFTYNEPATATLTAPAPGATLTGSTATFQWSGGVGIQYYELYVGTSGVASNNIYSSGLIPSGTLSETVTLPANEPTLYVRFRQLIGGVWQASDFTYNEPATATLTAPAPGSTLSGSTTFSWSGGVGVQYYELLVGTTGVGSDNLYFSGLTNATSESVTIPANGAKVYVRFRQLINGVWHSNDFICTEQ
jgi:predicted outer membrane repeat protein